MHNTSESIVYSYVRTINGYIGFYLAWDWSIGIMFNKAFKSDHRHLITTP